MKNKKEQKTTKQHKNGKKPVASAAVASPKPETKTKRTIKQVIIDTFAKNSAATNDEMIAAVKEEFPKSAFDERHASWYRSQARKGLLTGAPIAIPAIGRKQPKTSE